MVPQREHRDESPLLLIMDGANDGVEGGGVAYITAAPLSLCKSEHSLASLSCRPELVRTMTWLL